MGLFGAAHGCGEGGGCKKTHLPKICHTPYNGKPWHSYTSSKEDPKNI